MPDASTVALLVSVALLVVSGLTAGEFVRRRYSRLPSRGKDPKHPGKDILVSLGDALGPVNWDFTESWASTMTAVGALLGTVLAEQTVPDGAWPLPSAALTSLSLLFGALALLAPLAFKALAAPPDTADGDAEEVPLYQGNVRGYLIASGLTLWAVWGQLATLVILLYETKGTLIVLAVVFMIVAATAALMVGRYAWRTMKMVILYRAKTLAAAEEDADTLRRIRLSTGTKPHRWALL